MADKPPEPPEPPKPPKPPPQPETALYGKKQIPQIPKEIAAGIRKSHEG